MSNLSLVPAFQSELPAILLRISDDLRALLGCDAHIEVNEWELYSAEEQLAKEAPFAYVIEVARAIHRLCASIELPCFAKTSGATGMLR